MTLIIAIAVLFALAAIFMQYSQAKSKSQRQHIAIAMCAVALLLGLNEVWMRSTDWRLIHVPMLSTERERNTDASLGRVIAATNAATTAATNFVSENRDLGARAQK